MFKYSYLSKTYAPLVINLNEEEKRIDDELFN